MPTEYPEIGSACCTRSWVPWHAHRLRSAEAGRNGRSGSAPLSAFAAVTARTAMGTSTSPIIWFASGCSSVTFHEDLSHCSERRRVFALTFVCRRQYILGKRKLRKVEHPPGTDTKTKVLFRRCLTCILFGFNSHVSSGLCSRSQFGRGEVLTCRNPSRTKWLCISELCTGCWRYRHECWCRVQKQTVADLLPDKVSLVTAADSGIGRVCALTITRESATVVVSGLGASEAEKTLRSH